MLERASAAAAGRLAGLASRGDGSTGPRRTAAEEAAYQAAMREAFRSVTPPEPARLTRRPAAQGKPTPASPTARAPASPPAPESTRAPESPPAPAARAPETTPAWAIPAPGGPPAPATRALDVPPTPSAPQPAVDTWLTDTPEWWPVRPAAPSAEPSTEPSSVAPSTGPSSVPSADATVDATAGGTDPAGGPATPDDQMQVPGTVKATADDFFGGVVRRVDRRP
jgi:hypothetical protein